MKAIIKPYYLLLAAAILSFTISLIICVETIDINFSDTFYVINYRNFLRAIAAMLLIFSAFYKFAQNYLAFKILSWLHVIGTISLIVIAIWFNYNFNKSLALVETSAQNSTAYFSQNSLFLHRIVLVIVLLQILPFLNIIMGIINLFKRR